jgi:hypothetical protein
LKRRIGDEPGGANRRSHGEEIYQLAAIEPIVRDIRGDDGLAGPAQWLLRNMQCRSLLKANAIFVSRGLEKNTSFISNVYELGSGLPSVRR